MSKIGDEIVEGMREFTEKMESGRSRATIPPSAMEQSARRKLRRHVLLLGYDEWRRRDHDNETARKSAREGECSSVMAPDH